MSADQSLPYSRLSATKENVGADRRVVFGNERRTPSTG